MVAILMSTAATAVQLVSLLTLLLLLLLLLCCWVMMLVIVPPIPPLASSCRGTMGTADDMYLFFNNDTVPCGTKTLLPSVGLMTGTILLLLLFACLMTMGERNTRCDNSNCTINNGNNTHDKYNGVGLSSSSAVAPQERFRCSHDLA